MVLGFTSQSLPRCGWSCGHGRALHSLFAERVTDLAAFSKNPSGVFAATRLGSQGLVWADLQIADAAQGESRRNWTLRT
jgi:hypothetical protein